MSLLIHLTPFLLLILLYRLCPAHFPPSTTTSKLFLLYTLSCHLLAHGTSSWSLIQDFALIVFAHVLLAAIYLLHYLAKYAWCVKRVLLSLYAQVAKSVHLSVRNLATHIAQFEESSQDKNRDKDHLTETEIDFVVHHFTDTSADPVDDLIPYSLPPEKIPRLRQDWTSSALAFLHLHESPFRLYEFPQLFMLYTLRFYSLYPPLLDIVISLYEQKTLDLYIIRIRLILIIRRKLEPFCRMSSYLVILGNLYAPAIAIFTLHFIFWTIVLSIGELYALFVCLLFIFWMLSRLR
ncbi:uncharacterized protein TRIVIDRAFT_226448 [Trichoderma virens Gv29-8]|uniref:Uncharacterized protein n=1 Tax=Hypocrea virens (strain Gv29-8 / FGSC 10586) TaxID=413071 RepID=G9N6Z0_HYPVG|nr:uncharacterized protein TRIVIDRAFT_226448 [Trichoderma virens Gv29-8]EHK17488.1 hypothetical protein TRIVIDRAFT_226448 [Trichoderma virens Gv29-8]UKZ53791.1 hypothetical protein TrVGV298_007591 [Trichoderma virens]